MWSFINSFRESSLFLLPMGLIFVLLRLIVRHFLLWASIVIWINIVEWNYYFFCLILILFHSFHSFHNRFSYSKNKCSKKSAYCENGRRKFNETQFFSAVSNTIQRFDSNENKDNITWFSTVFFFSFFLALTCLRVRVWE